LQRIIYIFADTTQRIGFMPVQSDTWRGRMLQGMT